MASEVSVRDITVDYVPSGSTTSLGTSVDSVIMNYGVDELPYMDVSVHRSDGDVVVEDVLPANQIVAMASAQEAAFGDRNEGSFITINVTSKEGTQQEVFAGYPVAPTQTIGQGMVKRGIRILGVGSRLNAIRPYIYGPSWLDVANDQNVFLNPDAPVDANILERYLTLLEQRMEFFENDANINVSSLNSAATAEMARQIHTTNKDDSNFGALREIVKNSDEAVYESWSRLGDLPPEQQKPFQYSINRMLVEQGMTTHAHFFNTLVTTMRLFQLYYVPSSGSESAVGSFRPYRFKTDNSTAQTKVISPRNLATMSSDMEYGPIHQILVQGVLQSNIANYRADSKKESRPAPELLANTIYAYPENATAQQANFRTVGPPQWMPLSPTLLTAKEDIPPYTEGTKGWKITDYVRKADELSNRIDRVFRGPYIDIIKEYANNLYSQMALAPYNINARVPLDLDWEVGNRYRVVDEDQNLLFTGFLSKMRHSVSGLRDTLSADTFLTFTHVEYGTFELQ